MHTELVERRRWIDEKTFLHALNFCMLLPGPEATQLAIYCGWRLHGLRGGLAAGILFVLPAALLLWGLSWAYVVHGNLPVVTAIFHGLKPAVVAIVAAALIRIGRRSLRGMLAWALAVAAFGALFYGRVPFPVVLAAALALGFLVGTVCALARVYGGPVLRRVILPSEWGAKASLPAAKQVTAQLVFSISGPVRVAGAHWNEFLWPLMVVSSPRNHTLTIGLAAFTLGAESGKDWGLLAAGTLLVMAPLAVAFVAFQRRFVDSFVFSGVKG